MLKTYLAMELYLPERPTVNRITGRFMKGHVPANKGKKWGEYMSKRSQRRSAKGWRNLDIHRNKNGRPDNAGRCRKQVVAVRDDGSFTVFGYVGAAAKAIGGCRENLGRCCRANASGKVLTTARGRGRGIGSPSVNTNHRYMGIRWYFESDYEIWRTKVNL